MTRSLYFCDERRLHAHRWRFAVWLHRVALWVVRVRA
jgi:hypothetical protein